MTETESITQTNDRGRTADSSTNGSADADRKARKAEANTAKVVAEAEKAKADAAKAAADAQKAQQEVADHDTAAAKAQREAEARKHTAEAEKDAAAARRAEIAALIPDLSSVKDSTLDVKDGPALWSSFLLGRAVNAAGQQVAEKVASESQTRYVLVTSDVDLATADAVYEDVETGLKELVEAANKALEKTDPDTIEEAVQTAGVTPIDTALQIVVGAVPAILSLLSAHRTLSSAAVTASDLAALAAVAGAMKTDSTTVFHDNFRLVPGGGVYTLAASVGAKRQELVARKIALGDKKSDLTADLATAKAELEGLQKAKPPDQALVLEAEKKVYRVQAQLDEVEVRVGVVESLLSAMDSFVAAIRAIPANGGRSALATAALHEQLHGGDGGETKYTHVLLVKTQSGQVQQMLDNRPLWFKDKYSTAVEASISYMLLDTASSAIVAAGTESAVQSAHGTIGDRPTLDGGA